MPKKAVALYLILALIGAAIFIYCTFPRTKDEIPTSNNQRPFPSSPGPNGVPVPESVPQPNTPKNPIAPSLRVMAWATGAEAKTLETEAQAFQAETGNPVSLTVDGTVADYRRDLAQAVASAMPPDVCLIDARDFSGLDPRRDLVTVTPDYGIAPRSIAAFTVADEVRAVPDEFSVDVLFYHPEDFDRAGIGEPDRHWNWDILEAMSRAMASLKLKNAQGKTIYPLELPADFDFWNVLCMQAGHPALDADVWHLADAEGKESQVRALGFLEDFFHELSVTAPLPKGNEAPGRYFAEQRASLLIGPSELTATLPPSSYRYTLLPSDMARASLARINGWAVTARASDTDMARKLARFLAKQPLHAGWCSVQPPVDSSAPAALCYEALGQALLPRLDSKTAPFAQFLDQQINEFARSSGRKTETIYAAIQAEYRNGFAPIPVESGLPQAAKMKVAPRTGGAELRDSNAE